MLESIILFFAIASAVFGPSSQTVEILPTLKINEVVFNIEIADTEEERGQGLSGRASLPEDAGMLFDFIVPSRPGFWMKEMNFPIDIVWIDNNWKIVDLTKNFSPRSYPQVIFPNSAVQYVLEINAGLIDINNFKIGDIVTKDYPW